MRRRRLSTIWALACTILLVAGEALAFYFAYRQFMGFAIAEISGFLVGIILAPIVHECGHIVFAKAQNMQIVYAKFFCFKIKIKNGKNRLYFASPFSADETQALPKTGGNMKKRATKYTLGGLIFGGAFFALVLSVAIVLTLTVGGISAFAAWGLVIYPAFLFFLNLLPCEYNSGKTDTLVYVGLKKGGAVEKNMLSAMEIQGLLFEGKSFAEIEESLYFNAPQLPEDEPLFAIMLDLRYRYWLEKGEMEKAADCINRLALSEEYLLPEETEKVAAELVYMHALNGDIARAEECGKVCKAYLQEETTGAKRVLSAFAYVCGKTESAQTLKAQAEALLKNERIAGLKKFEEILLSRLPLA